MSKFTRFPCNRCETGCDYNLSFFETGKRRPFIVLEKFQECQETFLKLGNVELFNNLVTEQDVFNTIQKIIYDIYNVARIIGLDATRLQSFINPYTVLDVNVDFNQEDDKNIDVSSLQQCKSDLLEQFRHNSRLCLHETAKYLQFVK